LFISLVIIKPATRQNSLRQKTPIAAMSSSVSPNTQAMAVYRAPTDAEIARFIATRNTMQMAKLVQGIEEPASQAAFTASLLLLPTATTGRCTTPEKAKKALNAFVGFRSESTARHYVLGKSG
jgi:hypothetical protein